MSLRWSVGASHEQGKRSNQEDSIFGEFDGENSVYPLIVLADGMGGHSDGEKASGLVTKTFFEIFRSRKGRSDASSPQMLEGAARDASNILRKAKEGHFPAWWKGKKDPIGSDAGCTLLAAHIDERAQEVYFLSVGDSLILLQTNGVWQWVNKRCLDTRLNQLLGKSRDDRYAVSDEEYEFQRTKSLKDPKAHGLTQAITGRREPNLVGHILGPFPLRAGDRFILASDGLEPFFVGDESKRDDRENFKELERFLADIPVPRPTSEVVTMCRQSQATAKNIVQKVLNLHRPNQDNISVVLVEIPSDKAPAVAVSRPRHRHDTEPSLPGDEITVPRDSERDGISVAPPYSKEFGGGSFWKKVSCFLLLLVIIFGGVIWNYRGVFFPPTGNPSKDGSPNRNVSNDTNLPIVPKGKDNEDQGRTDVKPKESSKLSSLRKIARKESSCHEEGDDPSPSQPSSSEEIDKSEDYGQMIREDLQEKAQSLLNEQSNIFAGLDELPEENTVNPQLIRSFKDKFCNFKSKFCNSDGVTIKRDLDWKVVGSALKGLKDSGEKVCSELENKIKTMLEESSNKESLNLNQNLYLDLLRDGGDNVRGISSQLMCVTNEDDYRKKYGIIQTKVQSFSSEGDEGDNLKNALKEQLEYLKNELDRWDEEFVALCRLLMKVRGSNGKLLPVVGNSSVKKPTSNDLFDLKRQLDFYDVFDPGHDSREKVREQLRNRLISWLEGNEECFPKVDRSAPLDDGLRAVAIKMIHKELLKLFGKEMKEIINDIYINQKENEEE